MNEQEVLKKKESENLPSKVDGSFEAKDGSIKGEFEEQRKNKMTLRRSLISPPYSAPKFVLRRINDFVMLFLASRYSKSLEEVGNDFHQMEPCVSSLLALAVVGRFEIQLEDADIIIDLVESFDKSSEDMSLPIAGLLEPLDHVELTLIIHLKDAASSAATSLVNISKALELKIVKLQFVEPEGIKEGREEKA
jgi:hypothetical protein